MISISQAKSYCREDISLIKNYAEAVADTTKKWFCHHINGEPFTGFSKKYLIKLNMYYNRPASELKFVTLEIHNTIHHTGMPGPNKGKTASEETRRKLSINNGMHREEVRAKMSASCKGRIPWNKGKKGIYSEEYLNKLRKPKSDETKLKISLTKRGKNVSK